MSRVVAFYRVAAGAVAAVDSAAYGARAIAIQAEANVNVATCDEDWDVVIINIAPTREIYLFHS